VITLARRHGVSPLLFWQLKKGGILEGDSPLHRAELESLRWDYLSAIAEGFLRDRELTRVLEALERVKVQVLVLKGAVLAHTVYPDPALRLMCDLDLLVRQADLDRLGQVLKGLGYVHHPEPPQPLNPFNTEFTGETTFRYLENGYSTAVDVHWNLFANDLFQRTVALDADSLWARAVPVQLGSVTALALSPEDTLAHTCLHISLHGFAHPRGYVDIMQLVATEEIDWHLFSKRVRRCRIRVACFFPLWQVTRTQKVQIPEDVLAELQPGLVRRHLGMWMMSPEAQAKRGAGHVWEHIVWLFIVDRLRDLVRLGLWLLFPGPAWLRERYRLRSEWQARAWVMIHPFVVLREGLRSLGAVFRS
jgi:hypothetical protein